MTNQTCRSIANMLVPYADGELNESDAQFVKDHLAECTDCREELHLLGRSLELAQAVWQEDVARDPTDRPVVRRKRKKRGKRPTQQPRYATARLTVMVLILIVTANLWLVQALGSGDTEPFHVVQVTGRVRVEDPAPAAANRITVVFEAQVPPVDKRTYPRPGFVEVKAADGTFSKATTNRYGDGVIVGPHRVRAWTYDADRKEVPVEIVPSEVEVGNGSNVLEFVVKR